jgi:endonuclease/exonuclease/phosphatase family metal-dependent hydrolase
VAEDGKIRWRCLLRRRREAITLQSSSLLMPRTLVGAQPMRTKYRWYEGQMKRVRPTSIPGLMFRLLRMRKRGALVIAALLVAGSAIVALTMIGGPCRKRAAPDQRASSAVRFASFNIEFFPKDQRQVQESFVLIEELGASAIGLQEITDTDRFTTEAKRRLGDAWDFVFQDVVAIHAKPKLHIGVLYNTDVFQLERVGSRNETRIDDRTQATLQVRLRHRASGERITMLVVHFKALPAGRERRIKQFAGLQRIVADLQAQGRNLVIMGDFNATDNADRDSLEALSSANLVWATEELPCSAFWERADDCPTSRLDHIFSWKAPAGVAAKGGCELGCESRNSCPLYRREVSDHCPVLLEMNNLSP